MDEVGFRIPRVEFRIPRTGFQIPKPRIPDSKGKKILDSGFRIPLHGANCGKSDDPFVQRGQNNRTQAIY